MLITGLAHVKKDDIEVARQDCILDPKIQPFSPFKLKEEEKVPLEFKTEGQLKFEKKKEPEVVISDQPTLLTGSPIFRFHNRKVALVSLELSCLGIYLNKQNQIFFV